MDIVFVMGLMAMVIIPLFSSWFAILFKFIEPQNISKKCMLNKKHEPVVITTVNVLYTWPDNGHLNFFYV